MIDPMAVLDACPNMTGDGEVDRMLSGRAGRSAVRPAVKPQRLVAEHPGMDPVDGGDVLVAPAGAEPAAWDALVVDLDGLAGVGDLAARRRGVVLRLLARGLTLEALDAVLPGWGRYLGAR